MDLLVNWRSKKFPNKSSRKSIVQDDLPSRRHLPIGESVQVMPKPIRPKTLFINEVRPRNRLSNLRHPIHRNAQKWSNSVRDNLPGEGRLVCTGKNFEGHVLGCDSIQICRNTEKLPRLLQCNGSHCVLSKRCIFITKKRIHGRIVQFKLRKKNEASAVADASLRFTTRSSKDVNVP